MRYFITKPPLRRERYKGGLFLTAVSILFCQKIRERRVCSDEDFMREAGAEAEAGDEAVEAVGVEKVSGDREVLFKDFPLFLGERILQFGIKVAMLLRKLLDFAARTDGALAG